MDFAVGGSSEGSGAVATLVWFPFGVDSGVRLGVADGLKPLGAEVALPLTLLLSSFWESEPDARAGNTDGEDDRLPFSSA